jgi:hypothetical protein
MASKHSDKWDQLYFLKYHGDEIIDESAEMYTTFFGQVPSDHKITTGESDGTWTSVDDQPFAFGKVTISDKLFIVSHGEANGELGEGNNADTLARDLKMWGLRKVGLITFKCCNLGRGGFLDMFISACTRRGITIGWAKGYTGRASTERGIAGDPYEFVKGDHGVPKVGDGRFKISQGNSLTPLAKFERYSYAEEEKQEEEAPKPAPKRPVGITVTKGTRFGKSIWESRTDPKK